MRKGSTHHALKFLCQLKYHVRPNNLTDIYSGNSFGLGSDGARLSDNQISTCCIPVMNNWAEVT
jgi:demethoxyubiquinone hydroxylase (CLK1/Coq7/Cat5 family)